MFILIGLVGLGLVSPVQSQKPRFEFVSCNETLVAPDAEECTGDLRVTGWSDISFVESNYSDYFKVEEVENSEPKEFQLIVSNLSDMIDIVHVISLPSWPVKYTDENGTVQFNLNFKVTDFNNTRSPEFAPGLPAKYENISKLYPINMPLEIVYTDINIIAVDIDYAGPEVDNDSNIITCKVESQSTEDLIDCTTKRLDLGKYKISLFFTKSALEANLGPSYSFQIKAQDKGDPPLSSVQNITLVFSEENLQAPTFSGPSYTATIPNQKFSEIKILTNVSAFDGDGNTFTFVFAEDLENQGINFISLENNADGTTADIKWISEIPLNYRSKTLGIPIKVEETSTAETRSSIAILVLEIPGDNSPISFTNQSVTAIISLDNRDLRMEPVFLQVKDEDSWQTEIQFEIVPTGMEVFVINKTSGGIFLELKEVASIDDLLDKDSITLLIQAFYNDDLRSKITYPMTVELPYNKASPIFDPPNYSGTVDIEAERIVLLDIPIKASDPDNMYQIVYSLVSAKEYFELRNGLNGQDLYYKGDNALDYPVTVIIQAKENITSNKAPRTALAEVLVTFKEASSTSTIYSSSSSSDSSSSSSDSSSSSTDSSTSSSDSSTSSSDSSSSTDSSTESTTSSGSEVVEFVSGDSNGSEQYVGYPSFVLLENTVPMPITKVIAQSSREDWNSKLKYSLEISKDFFIDEISGDILAVNPGGGRTISDVCADPARCKIVVRASLGDDSDSLTVYVESVDASNILVLNTQQDPKALLEQLNQNKNNTWFRLMNIQVGSANAREEALNKIFVTGRRTREDGQGEFVARDEAEEIVSELGLEITISDDIYTSGPDSGGEVSSTVVVVLAVLLSLAVVAFVVSILVLKRRPILKKMKSFKQKKQPVQSIVGKETKPDNEESSETSFTTNKKTRFNQTQMSKEFSQELERRLATGKKSKVESVTAVSQAAPTPTKKTADLPADPSPVKKTADPTPVILTADLPAVATPVTKTADSPVAPARKRAAPQVPAVSYVTEDVKFNDKVQVMEIEEDTSSDEETDSSDSSSVSSTSSGQREKSDVIITTI